MNEKSVQDVNYADLSGAEGEAASPWVTDAFKLIGGLKVKVTAVLGASELTVQQLMDMKSGEAVKLDTPVDGLVDLYLEGKFVARGELVAIGDNFGVRLTEVGIGDPEAKA